MKEKNVPKVEETDTEVKKTHKKKKYVKPEIDSEELMAFGALCNHTKIGGRKSAAGAPDFCNASRLLS